jgi:Domain of unknown function (DUF1731)
MKERLSRLRTRVFAGNLRTERGKHVLLAMQKVEGSNPFSRSLGSGSTEPQTVSLSEVADFVTASLRVMPRRALDKGYTFRFPELEPALRDLLGK